MKFVLPMPVSLNRLYKITSFKNKHRLYKDRHVVAWENEAGWEVKRQWKHKKMIELPVEMIVDFFVSHDRDIDGGLKVLLDLFQKQQVYKNDSQIQHLDIRKFKDLKNPRVEVSIVELADDIKVMGKASLAL